MVQRRYHNRRATVYTGTNVMRPLPEAEKADPLPTGRKRSIGSRSNASAERRVALLLWIDAEGSITLDEARVVLAVQTNQMPSHELNNMVEEGLLVWSTMCGERTRVWCRAPHADPGTS